ncbi:MAG TPA: hypothetical protein VLE97_00040 [Gaiellaceae bacterium]|nr:hypothetical protein [Gaiellaceae bacterium]
MTGLDKQALDRWITREQPEDDEPVTLRVPGSIFDDCLDPRATDVPKDHDWPTPRFVRRGYGVQAVYVVERETALEIVDWILDRSETLSFGVDLDEAANSRRSIRWARKTWIELDGGDR